ncbi:MAG: HipA N-terminal domain-containing protein [Chlamydiae bacterium]|nr:HipA N-terminal domain-containing protein [Chlamydiota bacterium]MBI3266865.1 HipA N-terminal domain-containing protein [Chlamydiota bacterium]
MKKANIFFDGRPAGILTEANGHYIFAYRKDYKGPSISRTLPREKERFEFEGFPLFFDGLLPEGVNLEAFLRKTKIDRRDYFSQILAVGHDLVGAVTVEEWNE